MQENKQIIHGTVYGKYCYVTEQTCKYHTCDECIELQQPDSDSPDTFPGCFIEYDSVEFTCRACTYRLPCARQTIGGD